MRTGLLLALLATAASAQSASISTRDPSRAVTLPPTSAAVVDDATAAAVNPAGLISTGISQLFYIHERNLARNSVGDALYLGTSALRAVATGLAVEWFRSPLSTDFRRTGLSLAVGSPAFSIGATYNFFSSHESYAYEQLTSIDLGVSIRPARFISFGGMLRNLDAPERFTLALPRQLDLAVAVRPLDERFTLAVDFLADPDRSLALGRFGYTLQARLLKGVTLSTNVSHPLASPGDLQFQLGITLDTAHFGATYAAGGALAGLSHVVAVRAGGPAYPGLDFGGGKIALFDLDDLLSNASNPLRQLLGTGSEDPFIRLIRLFHFAERDRSLSAVVLKFSNLPGLSLGKAEELRQAVMRLRAAGKRTYAVLLSVADAEYLVASAADKVYAVPEATLMINGLAATISFYGGTMEKLGVSWDVARVGAYKNAPDALTRTDLSDEQRETIDAYLDANARYLEATVTRARGLSADGFAAVMREGIIPTRRAVELKLVDEVVDPETLNKRLDELNRGESFVERYRTVAPKTGRWGAKKKVAIIPVIGSISGGKSREDPLGATEIAGAETVVKALNRAAEDDSVKAIVVRIDSPGGDGLASDLMYRAVLDAKKKKPVVASMGGVAASGGYYAAMGADRIYASPTTLTGSIGVFLVKPALRGLADKLGISQETLTRAPYADILNGYRPWTDEEREVAQKWIDAFYDSFISEVASARKLDKAKVDAVARGRVWVGQAAKENGLVDEFGGLSEAIADAQARAKIAAGDLQLEVLGEPGGLFGGPGEEGVSAAAEEGLEALARVLPDAQPSPLQQLARELGAPLWTLQSKGPVAMMPFTLEVD